MNQIKLAEKIKKLRMEKAWSQAQLAEVSSLSIRTIQRVELNGKCSYDTLLAIAAAFDIDVKELTALSNNNINSESKFSFHLFGLKLNFGWLRSRTAFITGIFLLLPACYFITASVLKYNFGISFLFNPLEIFYSSPQIIKYFNLISPVIFLFGLTSAIVINILAMFSIKLWRENSVIQSEISFSPKALNLSIAIVSVTSFLMIIIYYFAENYILR